MSERVRKPKCSRIRLAAAVGLLVMVGWMPDTTAQPAVNLKPGKVVLQGSYSKKKLRQGRRRVTFYSVPAGKSLRLRLGGPARLVLQARGERNASASVEFSLDGKQGAKEPAKLSSRISRGFYVRVPAGTHHLEVSAGAAVMLRPVKVSRGPMSGEKVVVFKSPTPAAATQIAGAEKAAPAKPPPADKTLTLVPLIPPADKKPVSEKPTPPSGVAHQAVKVRTIEARLVSEPKDTNAEQKPAAAGPSPVERVEQVPARALGLRLDLAVGGGAVDQTYTHNQQTFNLAAAVGWRVVSGIVLDLSYHGRFGWQQYLSRNPDPDGASLEPQLATVREQFWDIGLGAGFDLLRNEWYRVLSALGLEVSLAPRFLALANDVFGSWAAGIRLGLKLDGSLAKDLHLAGWGGWLLPFAGSQNDLGLAGGARHFWDYGLGLRWSFAGRKPIRSWSVELGWRGSTIIFEHASRTYNAAVLSLGTEL